MIEASEQRITTIISQFPNSSVSSDFINRIKEGELTRDENPTTHFCVYFAAYDPEAKKIFIGHHKKSDLWLFNGGHTDKGETPEETLKREMNEEWGTIINSQAIGEPKMLTITPINNPAKQKCTKHFDIWFFVPVSIETFKPDKALLDTEFYTTDWKSINEARSLIIDPNTLKAVSEFEKLFEQQ